MFQRIVAFRCRVDCVRIVVGSPTVRIWTLVQLYEGRLGRRRRIRTLRCTLMAEDEFVEPFDGFRSLDELPHSLDVLQTHARSRPGKIRANYVRLNRSQTEAARNEIYKYLNDIPSDMPHHSVTNDILIQVISRSSNPDLESLKGKKISLDTFNRKFGRITDLKEQCGMRTTNERSQQLTPEEKASYQKAFEEVLSAMNREQIASTTFQDLVLAARECNPNLRLDISTITLCKYFPIKKLRAEALAKA
jgi:hypothetical protein